MAYNPYEEEFLEEEESLEELNKVVESALEPVEQQQVQPIEGEEDEAVRGAEEEGGGRSLSALVYSTGGRHWDIQQALSRRDQEVHRGDEPQEEWEPRIGCSFG